MTTQTAVVPTPTVWSQHSTTTQQSLLLRPSQQQDQVLQQQVAEIIDQVRHRGDLALNQYSQQFDGVNSQIIHLDEAYIQKQMASLNTDVKEAIDTAYKNIRHFHALQQPSAIQTETSPGVTCELRFASFDSVGLYIPGGSAVLPSTVLMLGVPAQLAGCRQRILVTPPHVTGQLSPAIAYAAFQCGITTVVLAGGAQAIAALAFGTESIPAVDKIFGPGNAYVTAAKQQVSQHINGPVIDIPAGPSELLVIADQTADPAFVAADLLSQAEHGPDSQVLCLSPSFSFLEAVQQQLEQQLLALPRQEIARQALANSRLIATADLNEAIAISQRYAPEHLSIQIKNCLQEQALKQLTCAGSIFVGHYTPESGGDYATGTNHVLPTYGRARYESSVGLLDFYRRYTVQRMSPYGLAALGPTIMTLATLEQLDAHARAVSLRLNSERFLQDTQGQTS